MHFLRLTAGLETSAPSSSETPPKNGFDTHEVHEDVQGKFLTEKESEVERIPLLERRFTRQMAGMHFVFFHSISFIHDNSISINYKIKVFAMTIYDT